MTAPPTSPALDRIREKLRVGPPTIDPWTNTLIYADTGVGKTYLAATANTSDKTGPLLLLDCNKGAETALPLKSPDGKIVDTRQIRTVADLIKIQIDLYRHNNGWYKTVCIDDSTELNDIDMSEIMVKADEASNNDNFNIDVPSPREYGIARSHFRKVIRAYKDMPFNLIMTCYEYTVEKEGRPDRIMPSLVPAKLRTEIPGFMDIVGHYRFGDTGHRKRVLQVQGTNRTQAKNRYDMPATIDDPTFPMIYEMVEQYRIKHTDTPTDEGVTINDATA